MKCPICKSTLMDMAANARRVVKGQKFTFRNVPALICSNEHCGQIIFDSLIVEDLEKAEEVLSKEELDKGIVSYSEIKERLANLQMI